MHYEMLVIGTGPAGQKAAVQSAKLGKKVGIIERAEVVGGVCINSGTIPSKSLREAVLYLSGFHQRAVYGAEYRLKQDITMEDLAFRCSHVITEEIHIIQKQMARNNVDLMFGTARFIDPHRLVIRHGDDETEQTADHIVVAVGSKPARPDTVPFDGHTVIDTDEWLTLNSLPTSLIIIGGGVIGSEYASIAATMGIKVMLIDQRPRLLEFADHEIIDALQVQMTAIGVDLHVNEQVVRVQKEADHVSVQLQSGKQLNASMVMYSAGRIGATAELNLEAIGIQPDARGRLKVNEHFQTTVPHIYAVGDVIGFPALASTSMLALVPPLLMTGRDRPNAHPVLFALMNGGTIGVLVGFWVQDYTIVGISGALIVVAFLSLATDALRQVRTSLVSPPLNLWFYGTAVLALLAGLGFGESMAFRTIPLPFLGQGRLAHIHLNLLGFATLSIIGTMGSMKRDKS